MGFGISLGFGGLAAGIPRDVARVYLGNDFGPPFVEWIVNEESKDVDGQTIHPRSSGQAAKASYEGPKGGSWAGG